MAERSQLKRDQKQIINILAKDCKLNAGQQDILSVSILRVKPASKNEKLYSNLVITVSVIIAILVIILVILLATMRTSSPTDSGDGTTEENPAAVENDTKTDKSKAPSQNTQEKKTTQPSAKPDSDAISANNKDKSSTSAPQKETSNSDAVRNAK